MRRINANFDAAAYRQQMRSPEVAPVPGYAPDAAFYAAQTPVAVLEPPVLATQAPVGHVDFVAAPPVPTDTQVPTNNWTALYEAPTYEAPQEDPNAFRPINPRNPFDVDRSYQIITERIAKKERKEIRRASREAWIGRNATRATTILFAASSVVALATSLGLVHNNLNNRPSTPEVAAPSPDFIDTGAIEVSVEVEETTTTSSTTTTTTPTTTQAPPTTEAPAPTIPAPEAVIYTAPVNEVIGTFRVPVLCANIEFKTFSEAEKIDGVIGTGNAQIDKLVPEPNPVAECPEADAREAEKEAELGENIITRRERGADQYLAIAGHEQRADGQYITPFPGQPGNSVIAGHRSTFNVAFGDLPLLNQGDVAYFDRSDGTTFTYKMVGSEILSGYNDTDIRNYSHPEDASTLTTYMCSDAEGRAGSAENRYTVRWVLTQINGVDV